ncbi:MAG: TldD/PmbA family protein [Acidobacteriia bacterium]|nr:TldD/PmbA family protein [Terriglobia bacterium]
MTIRRQRRSQASRRARRRRAGPAVAAAHLLPQAELERIAEQVFRASDADETEVLIEAVTDALTRFANNTIHQNVAEQAVHVSVRTVYDGRTARAATNRTDAESLRRVAAASSALARVQPKHPDLLPMPGPQRYRTVQRFFPATAAATPEDRARAVLQVLRMIERHRQTAAGILATGCSQMALANSRGLFASHQQTRAEFSITVLEPDSSGWQKANTPDLAALDPLALAERASQKAAAARAPRELEPGRYTVVLEPSAALDLLGFLFYDFAGTAVLDQRSCLNERLGKPIFGRNISLWDDVYHPLQTGAPFDGEGIPRQKVLLVDRGVPCNLVYARHTARKMNARPTGHALPLPSELGEAPVNLVWAGGDTSLEAMIASTERGILVTRLWYIREVDPYEKILTGMTRDGTFLIENGRLVCGIRNFRFNQSLIEMLANVEQLGPAVRAAGEESFEMVVPAMKVANFHFTEVTKF